MLVLDIETIPAPLSDREEELCTHAFEKSKTEDIVLFKSTNYLYGKIICISTHNGKNAMSYYGDDEKQLLESFWDGIKGVKAPFITFNGNMFDIPFILKRSLKHGVLPTNDAFSTIKRFSTYPHYDIRMIMHEWNTYAAGTLDQVTAFLGIPTPKGGEVVGSNVYNSYLEGKLELIKDYCEKDVLATYFIYQAISPWYPIKF